MRRINEIKIEINDGEVIVTYDDGSTTGTEKK